MALLVPWWCLLCVIGCHSHVYKQGSSWNGYEFHSYPHPAKKPAIPREIMVDVINNLGLKLLAIHNEHNENNIAISPYGALSVLIALGEGVQGDAVYEIQHAAHLPNDISIIRVGLRDIHRHLKSYFIPKEGFLAGLTLNHDNVTLRPEYEEILKFYGYDAVSFNNALYPDPETTIKPVTSFSHNMEQTTGSESELPAKTTDVILKTTTDMGLTVTSTKKETTTTPLEEFSTNTMVSEQSTTQITTTTLTETTATISPTLEGRGGETSSTNIPEITTESTTTSTLSDISLTENTLPGSVTEESVKNNVPEDSTIITARTTRNIPITTMSNFNDITISITESVTPMISTTELNRETSTISSSSPVFSSTESSFQTPSTANSVTELNSEPTSTENIVPATELLTFDMRVTEPIEQIEITTISTANTSTFEPTGIPTNSPTLYTTTENIIPPFTTEIRNIVTSLPLFTTSTANPSTFDPTEIPTNSPTLYTTTKNIIPPFTTEMTNIVTPLPLFSTSTANPSTFEPTEIPSNSPTLYTTTENIIPPFTTEIRNIVTALPLSTTSTANPSSFEPTEIPTNPPTLYTTTENIIPPFTTEITNIVTALPLFTTSTANPSTFEPTEMSTNSPILFTTTENIIPPFTTTTEITNNVTPLPLTYKELFVTQNTDEEASFTSPPMVNDISESTVPEEEKKIGSFETTTPVLDQNVTSSIASVEITTINAFSDYIENSDNVPSVEEFTNLSTNAYEETTENVEEKSNKDNEIEGNRFGGSLKKRAPFQKRRLTEKNMAVKNVDKKSTTKQNHQRNSRRESRSVVDYVIARYYDDHYIPHNIHKPYIPEDHSSFLVNGKYLVNHVNFMKYDTVLPFTYIPHLNAVALSFPLDSTKYYLLLLLPVDEIGVDKLICDLRLNGSLKYIIENLRYTHVRATIPSFMLKGYVTLTPTFQKLGVLKVFEPRQADFSPMTSERQIYVTNIEQAITVTIRNYVDPNNMESHGNLHQYDPVEFKADHPFLYFVIDSELQVTLMAGKIVNPLNSRIR